MESWPKVVCCVRCSCVTFMGLDM